MSLIRQLQDGTVRWNDAEIGDVDGSFPGSESHSNKIITLAEEPPHVSSHAHSPKLFLLQRFEALFIKVAATPPPCPNGELLAFFHPQHISSLLSSRHALNWHRYSFTMVS